jgi:hypothetical protein
MNSRPLLIDIVRLGTGVKPDAGQAIQPLLVIRKRSAEIEAALGAPVTAGLNEDFVKRRIRRLLAHKVEKPAGRDLTEENGQRSANALDTIEQVGIPGQKVEADTGAGGGRRCDRQTIQKGAGLETAAVKVLERILVDAALLGNHARCISQRLRDALRILVDDLLMRHDRDRRRRLDQGRVRLGRTGAGRRRVTLDRRTRHRARGSGPAGSERGLPPRPGAAQTA